MKSFVFFFLSIFLCASGVSNVDVPAHFEGVYELELNCEGCRGQMPTGKHQMVIMNHPDYNGAIATVHGIYGTTRFTFFATKIALNGRYLFAETASNAAIPAEVRISLESNRKVVGVISTLPKNVQLQGTQLFDMKEVRREGESFPQLGPSDIEGSYSVWRKNQQLGGTLTIQQQSSGRYIASYEPIPGTLIYFRGKYNPSNGTLDLYDGLLKWELAYRRDHSGTFRWIGASLSSHLGRGHELNLHSK